MYDALTVMVNHISKNGLPSGEGAAGAMLIFMVLCLVPVVAAVQGLCALLRKGRHVSLNLFLCALVDVLVAYGIYCVSAESLSSAFLANYIVPYAQKISFITSAIWAVCYLIASVLALQPEPIVYNDHTVLLRKGQQVSLRKDNPGLSELYIGLGWSLESDNYED